MRIDRFLSDMGLASRSEAKAAARSGGVTVNSVAVKDLSTHIDPERDVVYYLGRRVEYRRYTYVMLNKPEGYVSATEDSRLPVVTELLSEELRRLELFPVGRLDRDTTGLMILTNNGKLAHELLSPRHHVEKEYVFSSDAPLPDDTEERFRDGITLSDGYECKSAVITLDPDRRGGRIILTEGKYHLIKRMVAASGAHVTSLERIRFAEIPLDGELERGEWRMLTADEQAVLERASK